MPPKLAKPNPPSPKGKGKGKGKGNKQKRHKLNLKGWLKTAADWARFNAWAKTNALPRKVPEPEPIVRESRPLSQLRKRLLVISKPSEKINAKELCRLDLSVSKAALKAKPSKRVIQLAKFVWKDGEPCKESPNPITKAALNYKASPRIEEIARPHIHDVESCHGLEISENALKHKTTNREKKMSLAKKARDCPNSLTEEEIARLLTATGIRKSALVYKITDWVAILALPSYRFLKDRRDPGAKEMKEKLEASEDRGKKVLEEQQKKEEEKAEKGKKKGKKNKRKDAGEDNDEKKEPEEKGETEEDTKAKEKKEKRKKEKKKWRKEPGPCKTNTSISKAALKAEASERTKKIAKPNVHESKACRTNAFGVKKSALGASASERVSEMAKPSHPLDPVERPPPREKDTYGAPIFPKPSFGKPIPKVKPYKMGKYKAKKEAKKEPQKARYIHPVQLFPSIDPCIDPIGAKRQLRARKAAKEARKAAREAKEKGDDKSDKKKSKVE